MAESDDKAAAPARKTGAFSKTLNRAVEAGGVDPRKTLGMSLDGCVRSMKVALPGVDKLVLRTFELLRESRSATLELRPTHLSVDGLELLQEGKNDGAWLLPAFMAGLRALKPGDDLAMDDVQRIVQELAHVKATVASIERFRDWVWAGGAEGFQVTLDQSFTETMEAIASAEDRASPFFASPEAVTAAISAGGVLVPSWELDEAAGRSETQVFLDAFVAEGVGGSLESLDAGEKADLRQRCDDASSWTAAEVEAALAHDALRAAIPASRLARRLLAQAARGCGADTVKLIADLFEGTDPDRRRIAKALEEGDVGAALGRGLDAAGPGVGQALAALLMCTPETVCGPLLTGLLSRKDEAAGRRAAIDLLKDVGARIGLRGLRQRISEKTLDPLGATALVEVAWHVEGGRKDRSSGVAVSSVSAILDVVAEPAACAAIVDGLPAVALPALQGKLLALLASGEHSAHGALVGVLTAKGTEGSDKRWGATLLAKALADKKGHGWRIRALDAVLRALLEAGLGQDAVLPLVLARDAQVDARLLGLTLLEKHPALLDQALARRMSEVFEPKEIRDRLRDLRQAQAQRKKGGA